MYTLFLLAILASPNPGEGGDEPRRPPEPTTPTETEVRSQSM